MTLYAPVELLNAAHDQSSFDCGSDAQTSWLRRYALVAQRADTARVYAIRPHGEKRIAGFYALAAGSVDVDDATTRLSKGTARHPIPVIVLTRLGVDLRDQGQGLGSELVYDAFLQTATVAELVGARALLIHAETTAVTGFYRRLDPAFEQLPGNPLHIVLLMKNLRAAISRAADKPDASGG